MNEPLWGPTERVLRFAAECYGVPPEAFVPMWGGSVSYSYAFARRVAPCAAHHPAQ